MNAGWKVDARCPHGRTIRIPLDILQSYGQLSDPCPEAEIERALKPQRLSRKERRMFRRIARHLSVPSVEQPPSSETKEPQ